MFNKPDACLYETEQTHKTRHGSMFNKPDASQNFLLELYCQGGINRNRASHF